MPPVAAYSVVRDQAIEAGHRTFGRELVQQAARSWGLEVLAWLGRGRRSTVARCISSRGTTLVVKTGTDPLMHADEVRALVEWSASAHCVELLDIHSNLRCILLRDLGRPIQGRTSFPEWSGLLSGLGRPGTPISGEFPALSGRISSAFDDTCLWLLRRHGGSHGTMQVLAAARALALALSREGGPVGLVHGDLHPTNVLRGTNAQLVAIDPRPHLGDLTFDAIDCVLQGAQCISAIEARVEALVDSVDHLEPGRLMAWCSAAAPVLAVGRLASNPLDPWARELFRFGAHLLSNQSI